MVFYGWWMILSMDIIWLIFSGAYYYGLSAFIIPLTEEFRWTRTEISLGISLCKLETGFDGPITGWMSDHIGPGWTTMLCLALSGILLISLSFINSLWLFYVLMFMIFALPTSPYTAMITAVARWFNRKVGMAMGLLMVAGGLSGVLTPVLTWLIINYGWRTAFTVVGTSLLLCILPCFAIKNHGPEHYGLLPDGKALGEKKALEEKSASQRRTMEGEVKDFTLREVLKDRSYWLIAIAYSVYNLVNQAIVVHLIPHLISIGFEPGLAALGMSIVTLSSVAGRLVFGWLGDVFKKRYVYALCFAFMLVGGFVFTNVSVSWAIFLALAIYGPGMGGTIVARYAIQREYYGREHYGITGGFMGFIAAIPSYVGPVFAGLMFDVYGSYIPAFMPLILLLIIAMVLTVMAQPPKKH